MPQDHHHSHHHHHVDPGSGDRRVALAVLVNVVLTLAQIVGGILSGSLSLIADALHNFSDAASLALAWAARRIARRPADSVMTYGYVRAEVVAALINYTTLILIGLYLVFEAVMRFFDPQPVTGWLVVAIAGIALVVDLMTALLTYAMSRDSMNIRAAFLHNVADALGSIGVIVAGTVIMLFGWTAVDPIVTLAIAGYILWQAFAEIGGSVRLLMLGTPPGIEPADLLTAMRRVDRVRDVHHLHVWMIDERQHAMEAHVVLDDGDADAIDHVKRQLKQLARDEFGIAHSTLEFEQRSAGCRDQEAQAIGHAPARG